MSEVHVNVAIEDRASFEGTLRKAKKVGLKVEQSLDILGVAVGSIDRKSLMALRRVPGIHSVEEDREIKAISR